MKNPWLTAIVFLAIGFAVGWGIKSPEEIQAPEPGAVNRKLPREGSKPLILSVRDGSTTAPKGDDKEKAETVSRTRYDQAFKNVSNRADRARIQRLAEALGLNESQHISLDGLLAKRRADFAQATADPATAAEKISLVEEEFETEVLALLEPRQVEALGQFRERARSNEIAALAHRDMAELTALVDLSGEQHEKAFEAFREYRGGMISEGRSSVLGESFEQLAGGRVAVADPALEEVFRDAPAAREPGDFQRRYAEALKAVAETKEKLLEPILTPAQLTQYRAVLDSYVAMVGAPPDPEDPLPSPPAEDGEKPAGSETR